VRVIAVQRNLRCRSPARAASAWTCTTGRWLNLFSASAPCDHRHDKSRRMARKFAQLRRALGIRMVSALRLIQKTRSPRGRPGTVRDLGTPSLACVASSRRLARINVDALEAPALRPGRGANRTQRERPSLRDIGCVERRNHRSGDAGRHGQPIHAARLLGLAAPLFERLRSYQLATRGGPSWSR